MFYSPDAKLFVEKWGYGLDAVNDEGCNLVAYLAGRGAKSRSKRNLLSLQSAIRHGYKIDVHGDVWQSALHEAVDMHHWAMVDELLRHPISRSHLLKALGALLTHHIPLAGIKFGTRAELRYSLILFQRLDGATPDECLYLLCQAFNGSALPWFLPLMRSGLTIPPQEKWNVEPPHADGLWWDNFCSDPEEKSHFARLMRQFFCERLPRLHATHSHLFPHFELRENHLYFTGSPRLNLPLPCTRTKRHRLKDIEREALLFAHAK